MLPKMWLVFIIVYFLSDGSDGRRDKKLFRKDYSYIEKLESYYKIHMTPRTFTDAKQMCILEGTSLFYPENEDEANAVIEYWKRVYPSADWAVTVGLTDIDTEGEFKTIDGKAISNVYKNWRSNEPSNSGSGEDCVHLTRQGNMNDIPCDDRSRFICKKKDYNYIKAVDGYYSIHTTPRTFADAKRMCILEGAHLFYPENDNEAHAVIEFWNRTQPSTEKLFVGMSDLMTEGVFETINGKLIYDVYDHWLEGEPNDTDGSEDCIQLNRQGYIDDVPCDNKNGFICKSSLPSPWNDDCNMANLDYNLNKNIGKCYKLHTTPLTWTEAYAVCRAELSYLAVINNTLDADYLAKLTTSAVKLRVQGTHQKGIYHVGIHNRLNEGWQTVKGKSINDASAWWGNYQPPADDENKCGAIFYTGLLINIDCDTKIFFICEHEVDGTTNELTIYSDNEENFQ